jgi:hypothetical protein
MPRQRSRRSPPRQSRSAWIQPSYGAGDDGERHLEVRVGNVETVDGGRQVFGAVTRAETDITVLIQRTLKTVGRTDTTEVTAFTDGCPGLRAVLADAGGDETANFRLVPHRDADAAHEAGGIKFVDRQP